MQNHKIIDNRNKSGIKQALRDRVLPFHRILRVLLAIARLPPSSYRVNARFAHLPDVHQCKAQAAVKP